MEKETPKSPSVDPVALIVGVTGMAGLAIAKALNKDTALGGPWKKIYGVSRRPLPTWFPSSLLHQNITLDATDLDDTCQALSAISSEVTHVFWVTLQVRATEEENITVNCDMLNNVLAALRVSETSSQLKHVTVQTGTKHYMGPVFDPNQENSAAPHETPFSEEYSRLPYPKFYYALEDLVESSAKTNGFSYSIHRPSIIVGASSRSFYNHLLSIAVYATICKHQGLPFRYPGSKYTWEHFYDVTDAGVLAEQHIWAAVTDKAKNEAFNCTNGDIFAWKRLWKELCRVFDLEFIPFNEKTENDDFDITQLMNDKGPIWDNIVDANGLYKTKMNDITCFAALATVLKFDFQHVSSMNKSGEYGFSGHADTLKSVETWIQRLRNMNIIP